MDSITRLRTALLACAMALAFTASAQELTHQPELLDHSNDITGPAAPSGDVPSLLDPSSLDLILDSACFTRSTSLALAPAEDDSGSSGSDEDEKPGQDSGDLAKKSQNPIADLATLPFQNNFNFRIGPNHVTQYLLNVQPVYPIHLSSNLNLITRYILPVINESSPAPGIHHAFGLGDFNPSFFLSPVCDTGFTWGVGPTFTFPTATDAALGSGKWSAGPTAVGVFTKGDWVLGVLVNNQWSYAGWSSQPVKAMLLEPFINYNLPHAWYIVTDPIMTANWVAPGRDQWTVPVGGGFGKIFKICKQPINVQLSAYYNALTPRDFGPAWQLRFQFEFLFPK
jgi:hypothetical protein